MIFKAVGDARPYPDHGPTPARLVRRPAAAWCGSTSSSPPSARSTCDALLAEDSTFYGDLFAHVVEWEGDLYLEDGLHRALRAALQQRRPARPRARASADPAAGPRASTRTVTRADTTSL